MTKSDDRSSRSSGQVADDGARRGDEEQPIEVSWSDLAPETLRNLAEEFVTRDGTDYGVRERTLDEKVDRLMDALREGDARIFFEAVSGTVHIVASRDLS